MCPDNKTNLHIVGGRRKPSHRFIHAELYFDINFITLQKRAKIKLKNTLVWMSPDSIVHINIFR